MNVAAILPRFLQAGLVPVQPRPARTVAQPEQRSMARNAIMTLDNRPLQLCVLRGCIWITRDGCQADMVLAAGDVFEQQPGAPVLVQALEAVELLIAALGTSAQDA